MNQIQHSMISKPYRTAQSAIISKHASDSSPTGSGGRTWQRTRGKLKLPETNKVPHRLARHHLVALQGTEASNAPSILASQSAVQHQARQWQLKNDGEESSRRRCEKSKRKASKAVELLDHLRARGLRIDTRDATVFYDWEPTEAIKSLGRIEAQKFAGSFQIV